MKRWLVLVLPLTMGLVLPMSALAEDDLDWLDGDSGEDAEEEEAEEAEEEEEEESDDEDAEDEGDAFDDEEEEEEKKTKKKAAVSVSTDEPDENEKYVAAGGLHTFLGLGYALPVADLTGDGTEINRPGASGSVAGGLPIWFGADYFVIDDLAIGLKFRITPLFANGGDDAKGNLFDLHAQVGYHLFFPGLRIYLGLGYSRLSATVMYGETFLHEAHSFSLGPGLSYTFYLTEIGTGGLGLEIGFEYMMMFGPDHIANPEDGVRGTSADNVFTYPLFFVGLRYALGL